MSHWQLASRLPADYCGNPCLHCCSIKQIVDTSIAWGNKTETIHIHFCAVWPMCCARFFGDPAKLERQVTKWNSWTRHNLTWQPAARNSRRRGSLALDLGLWPLPVPDTCHLAVCCPVCCIPQLWRGLRCSKSQQWLQHTTAPHPGRRWQLLWVQAIGECCHAVKGSYCSHSGLES